MGILDNVLGYGQTMLETDNNASIFRRGLAACVSPDWWSWRPKLMAAEVRGQQWVYLVNYI